MFLKIQKDIDYLIYNKYTFLDHPCGNTFLLSCSAGYGHLFIAVQLYKVSTTFFRLEQKGGELMISQLNGGKWNRNKRKKPLIDSEYSKQCSNQLWCLWNFKKIWITWYPVKMHFRTIPVDLLSVILLCRLWPFIHCTAVVQSFTLISGASKTGVRLIISQSNSGKWNRIKRKWNRNPWNSWNQCSNTSHFNFTL